MTNYRNKTNDELDELLAERFGEPVWRRGIN